MKELRAYKNIAKSGFKTGLTRRFVILTVFFFQVTFVFGQPVLPEKAITIAKSFYYSSLSHTNSLKSAKTVSFSIAKIENITDKSGLKSAKITPAFFIVNIGETDGFIIVAGDERAKPILGYSLNGNYNQDEIPEHIAAFFNGYKNEISKIVDDETYKGLPTDKKWGELEFGSTKSGLIQSSFNLIPTNWGQGKNYNSMCPQDSAMVCPAYNGHVPTGCVAVVMSQIMRYWSWPLAGTGKNCYIPFDHKEYGEQCADFASASYNYNSMDNQISDSNNSVSQLVYHAAVSVKMNFSPSGSSTFSSTTVKAFIDNFNFSAKAEFVERSSYSDADWTALLKKHLDNGVPLYYRGDNEGKSAHAFICDGYNQEGLFHFNWGWDGRYNGFFAISAMSPISNYSYTSNQGAIINLFPANNDFTVDKLTTENTSVPKGSDFTFAYDQVYKGSDFNVQNVVFNYWLSADSIQNEADIFLGQDIATLSSENNRINMVKSIKLPETLANTELYILVEAKADNNAKEINTSNNVVSLKLRIASKKDAEATKSTNVCSDVLEPNNSANESFYLGSEANYSNNGLCLSEGDEDWFEFKLNSATYFVKVAAGKDSSHGFYGIRFNFTSGSIEVVTFETEGITNTKIWLYDSEMSLIAEDNNSGKNPFARLLFRPKSSTTSVSMFTEANFNVYPNPANRKVSISSGIRFDKDVTITLMDMRGTLLEKKAFDNVSYSSEFSFDLSRYADGQYVVGIYSADGAFVSKKIIKKSLI